MRELIYSTGAKYDGTLLYSYKLGEDRVKPIEIEYPIAVSKTVSGELCVYAVDENGTYLLIEVNGKKYNNLGKMSSFGFVNENNLVFSSDINAISLNMGRMDSSSIYSELIENAAANRIKVHSNYIIILTGTP